MSETIKTHRSGVVVAQAADTVEAILDRMAKQNLGSIVVVKEGKPAGIFTERDLLRNWRSLLSQEKLAAPIGSVMSSPVMTLRLVDIGQATEIMYERRIRHIPVVNNEGELVGIVSARDILAAAAKEARLKNKATVMKTAKPPTHTLHLIAPEANLISTCRDLLTPSWKTSVHSGVQELLKPEYWQETAKANDEAAFFIDIDGLKDVEWKALLRQLLPLLTKTQQPQVFLVWSPGKVSEKDLESLRTIAKSAKWQAYERPLPLGQLIDDLHALPQ